MLPETYIDCKYSIKFILVDDGVWYHFLKPYSFVDVVDKEGPIGDYVLLTITEISAAGVSHGNGESLSPGIPLYMRRFEGQTYVVGPNGVTIGSGLCLFLLVFHTLIFVHPSKLEA